MSWEGFEDRILGAAYLRGMTLAEQATTKEGQQLVVARDIEEAPPDPDTAKQRVEELLKTKNAPIGAEPREDALDDPTNTGGAAMTEERNPNEATEVEVDVSVAAPEPEPEEDTGETDKDETEDES